jgi:hypothetical protein
MAAWLLSTLFAAAQTGKLEGQPGRTMMESFESRVNTVLNKARDDAGKKAQQSLNWNNNIIKMVTSGSKGSYINISQVGGTGHGRHHARGIIVPWLHSQHIIGDQHCLLQGSIHPASSAGLPVPVPCNLCYVLFAKQLPSAHCC